MENICDDSPSVLLCLSAHFLAFLLIFYIINHDCVPNNEREII